MKFLEEEDNLKNSKGWIQMILKRIKVRTGQELLTNSYIIFDEKVYRVVPYIKCADKYETEDL